MSVRAFEHTVSVVCPQCLSILDAHDANFKVLQVFAEKTRISPKIPLGSRGEFRGTKYEVIGFQQRTIEVDLAEYSWHEYLLFNPYKGFRYFTEYNGHWNFVQSVRALPQPARSATAKPQVWHDGRQFTHFSTAHVETTYVLGEFPWQVTRGEKVTARDYISPPRILSSESTPSETTWSLGEYVPGGEVWRAFRLPGAPPRPSGVYLNQPSPYIEQSHGIWGLCASFLLLAVALLLLGYVLARNDQVFAQSYRHASWQQTDSSFVTPIFELKGDASNVEIRTQTDLSNNWAYFNYALINDDTGQAYDFGREVSYYYGTDSDGSWSEGSRNDRVTLDGIPGGRYYLRVEPETPANLMTMNYTIGISRDVPGFGYFFLVGALLLLPPVWVTYQRIGFERARWKESDYAPASSDDDEDD